MPREESFPQFQDGGDKNRILSYHLHARLGMGGCLQLDNAVQYTGNDTKDS